MKPPLVGFQFSVFALAIAFGLAANRALAQSKALQGEQVAVYVWVDPIAGNDATGDVNDPAQPLKTMQAAPPSGTTPVAWHQPPATLFRPVVDVTSLPLHYQSRYIAFNDTAPSGITLPTPWSRMLLMADEWEYQPTVVPTSTQAPIRPVAFSISDDECTASACAHWYFNSQSVLRSDSVGPDLLWSNLQAEYR